MPAEDDLWRLYKDYFTHTVPSGAEQAITDRLMSAVRTAHYAHEYGYGDHTLWKLRAPRVAGFFLPGYRAQWDAVIFYLARQPGGRLLEIGCGNGLALQRLSELGWKVEGLETDPVAVDVARARGLNVHLGDIKDHTFENNCFDAVVMSHVIEHVPVPRVLLQHCHRILKPGGRLVSVTPNALSWGHNRYGRDWLGIDAPRHLHLFQASSLRLLAAQAGFPQAHVSSVAALAHTFLWYSRQLQTNRKVCVTSKLSPYHAIQGRVMQLRQWFHLKFCEEDGEELVLKAVKTD